MNNLTKQERRVMIFLLSLLGAFIIIFVSPCIGEAMLKDGVEADYGIKLTLGFFGLLLIVTVGYLMYSFIKFTLFD